MNPQSFIYSKEAVLAKIQKLTLFDNSLLSFIFRNKDACEYLIRILMHNSSLRIIENRTQTEIAQLITHGARLDVLAVDEDGAEYEIEIQKEQEAEPARRMRYYAAVLDGESLQKGAPYDSLPELYLFYISKGDIWRQGLTVYPVKQFLGSTGLPYDNGLHTTYINAAVDDGSEIARLMQYFKTASTEDNSHGILSHCINELKTGKGGSQAMDEFTREYYIEGKAEGEAEGKEIASLAIAANLKKMKIMSDEAIAKATNLSLEQVQAITA